MLAAAARFTSERLSYAVVGVVGLIMVLVTAYDANYALHLGTWAFSQNASGVVTDAGAAAEDGLRKGDVIAMRALTPAQRFSLGNAVLEGTPLTLRLERGRAAVAVTVTTRAVRSDVSSFARNVRFVGLIVGFLGVVGLASLVFLANPRPATLGFYCYAIVMFVKTYQSTLTAAPWPFDFAGDIVVQIFYPLAEFLILLFAAQIFEIDDRVTRTLLRLGGVLAAATFFAWTIPIVQSTFDVPGLAGDPGWWMAVADFALIGNTLVGLAYVARVAPGSHTRIRLVLIGIALPALNDFTWSISAIANLATDGTVPFFNYIGNWTDVMQPWLGPVAIALVAYGLVLRRVVGFRSLVAQTAVASLASLVLLALFTLVDWGLDKIPGEDRDFARILTLLISGFVLRLSHHHIDEFVKNVLFKQRIDNAKALHEAANALACTAALSTIQELLLGEPLRILKLPACALFLAQEAKGSFVRCGARGDADDAWPQTIVDQGLLAARLRAERRTMRMTPDRAREFFLDCGFEGVLAVPLFLRGDLGGIAVYAERPEDAPIDDEQLLHFERLAVAAAAALDHLDACAARAAMSVPIPA